MGKVPRGDDLSSFYKQRDVPSRLFHPLNVLGQKIHFLTDRKVHGWDPITRNRLTREKHTHLFSGCFVQHRRLWQCNSKAVGRSVVIFFFCVCVDSYANMWDDLMGGVGVFSWCSLSLIPSNSRCCTDTSHVGCRGEGQRVFILFMASFGEGDMRGVSFILCFWGDRGPANHTLQLRPFPPWPGYHILEPSFLPTPCIHCLIWSPVQHKPLELSPRATNLLKPEQPVSNSPEEITKPSLMQSLCICTST